jgi:hypothetical protein
MTPKLQFKPLVFRRVKGTYLVRSGGVTETYARRTDARKAFRQALKDQARLLQKQNTP